VNVNRLAIPIEGIERGAPMSAVDGIDRELKLLERGPKQPAVVWICSECFDVYDRQTLTGTCPNPGHAPVELVRAQVRSLDAIEPALPARPREDFGYVRRPRRGAGLIRDRAHRTAA